MSDSDALEGDLIIGGEDSGEKSFLDKVKELTSVRQVEAVETGREFYTVGKDLNPILAGYTQFVNFDSGKAKGLVFIEKDSNKQYSLGNPNRKQQNYKVINHAQVLEPLAEAGFQVQSLSRNRGGIGLFALMSHPEINIGDALQWDSELYPVSRPGTLQLSIAAWLDGRVGSSLRLAVGFFRTVCQNGLVSAILGLGHLRMTHQQFAPHKVKHLAEKAVNNVSALDLQTFDPRVLSAPMKMLETHQRDDTYVNTMPSFVAKPFMSSVGNLPANAQDEFLYQMNLAQDSEAELSTLDILNMITNVNHTSESDGLLFRMESITEAFINLLEVSAFKLDLDFPRIITNTNVR